MLAKANRIRSATDYRRLVRTGRRKAGAYTLVSVRGAAGDAPMRLGVIVAKNVGNAVARNRVRRRIKAVGWELARERGGIDVVVRALPAAAAAEWLPLRAEVRNAIAALADAQRGERRKSAPS